MSDHPQCGSEPNRSLRGGQCSRDREDLRVLANSKLNYDADDYLMKAGPKILRHASETLCQLSSVRLPDPHAETVR